MTAEHTTAYHMIEVAFEDVDERDRAFEAIEKLLGEMGQAGTLLAYTERDECEKYAQIALKLGDEAFGRGSGNLILKNFSEKIAEAIRG